MSFSTSSVGPPTPEPEQRPAAPSEDEDIARYLSAGQSFSSDFSEPGPTTDELFGHPDLSETTFEPSLGPTCGNNVATANRLARRQKLRPYQAKELESLAKSSLSIQILHLLVEQFATRNRLEEFLTSQPPFKIKKPLADTISSYALAVLMSEHISAYKGNMPTDCVINLIIKNNVNVPANLLHNPYALNLVKLAVGEELTQARARIKRYIGESINKDWAIPNLALKVIEGSQINVSVATCARIAIMRKVYSKLLNTGKKVGNDYWNKVDDVTTLERILRLQRRQRLEGE
ncbi:hypothetical protein Agabi119p4_7675 [Agaricus bisporus var. burnettii]|uniref:Uncharacterized protein n=1 Tax=Agaricus bisporus var. burnettii TaxID=192524 RepID=A0A8H7C7I9_AGABI|nr:hypothetical protein Agabi119p4_7675 [Agaricus bisporus var. burnettii]